MDNILKISNHRLQGQYCRDDRPAPRGNSLPRKKLVLPRPAKIDKIRGASRGKVDCAVDSDIRI